MLLCRYCDKESKSKNAHSNHERCCPRNPNRNYRNNKIGKKGGNQFSYAQKNGLEKPKAWNIGLPGTMTGKQHTNDTKQKISTSMKLVVRNKPESYNSSNRGRTKQIVVDGIKFTGQWEVDFYLWAKENELNPKRVTTPFKYVWDGERNYFPDFYIESLDLYIEVKGYETDRDRAKWEQFPKKLKVLKKKEIYEIRQGTFVGL